MAAVAQNFDATNGAAPAGSNIIPNLGIGNIPDTGSVMAGGMGRPQPLDDDARKVWEQAKDLQSARVPDNYLSAFSLAFVLFLSCFFF